jgi:EF-P beta-lysylation protein EpmB
MATNPALPDGAAPRAWQAELRDAVRDVAELAGLLELPADVVRARVVGESPFPLLVPRGFVARMRKRDPDDPLLLQVLPLAIEQVVPAGYSADPLEEQTIADEGLLQKYAGRALLITSGACPVHCRYCFRRSFPYQTQLAARSDWSRAMQALRGAPDVEEVILSGGDPLSLSNRRLSVLLRMLASIPALRRVRIHTRFPIMVPERVDRGLIELLTTTSLQTVVVVHANHAREIDAAVAGALQTLKRNVDQLLNQSVLLHGVNDRADTLIALSERLFECGALPYYLHMLDPVAGAAHFAVKESFAIELMREIRAGLPGYLVPRLVREIPGEPSKSLIF